MLRKTAAFLFATTLLISVVNRGVAQESEYVGPTEGLVLPVESITETRNATALSANPANLAFLDSWSFVYLGSWLQNQQHTAGHGHGFFFGFPIGMLSLGVSTEFLTPSPEMEAWQGLDDRARFSIGMALNFHRALSIGAAYRTFWYYGLGDIDTFDLALTVQPSNFLALSFVASDINAPKVNYFYDSRDAARRFNVGLTFRPFANDRLALGGELNYLYREDFSRTDAIALLSVMLVDGLVLRGRLGAEGVGDDTYRTGYFLDGAIEIDLPNFGVGVSMHGQVHPSDSTGYHGTTWSARFSGDEAPSIVLPRPLRPTHAVEIAIEEPLSSYGMARLIAMFERISNDRSVDMVLFRPGPGTLSLAQSLEVRRLLKGVNNSGRTSVCYLAEATSPVYLACAGAKAIWINPAGGVRLAGLSTTAIYFKGLFDKLGVEADIVRIGEYKSAPEQFTKKGPSPASEYQMNAYLDSTYAQVLHNLSKDRGMENSEATRNIVEQGPFTPKEARKHGLVDKIVPADTLREELKELAGGSLYFDERYGRSKLRNRRYLNDPAVAVIHISGQIVDGESVDVPVLNIQMAGDKTLTEVIQQVRKDSRIHAVVLRIDSPGGSALASENIWRELMALRKEKPVIASMGSVAASGGYYIASAADEIFAEATTLTGSIGIYYGKAHIDGLLAKVGIDTTTYKRGSHADVDSWTRPYTPEERKRLMSQIREYYDLFRERVVQGRGRGFTVQIVDKLGRGRIWSGRDAKHHLLVDEIGGLEMAINRAREMGRVPRDIKVFHYPKPKRSLIGRLLASAVSLVKEPSPFEQILSSHSLKRMLRNVLPFAYVDPESPRAALPFVIKED